MFAGVTDINNSNQNKALKRGVRTGSLEKDKKWHKSHKNGVRPKRRGVWWSNRENWHLERKSTHRKSELAPRC
jgi:hypothetical protein